MPAGPRPRMAVVLVADDQVDRAEPQAGQRLLELELEDLHPDLRVVGPSCGPRPGSSRRRAADCRPPARTVPRTSPLSAARSASAASAAASSTRACWASSRPASVSRTPRPAFSKQRRADVLLQQCQLLGDRGRAVAEGGGDRGEGAPLLELAQEAQAAKIQRDHAEMLTSQLQESSLDLTSPVRRCWTAWVRHCVSSRRRASARWRSSASSPTTAGVSPGALLLVRFSLAAALLGMLLLAAARSRAGATAPGRPPAPRAAGCWRPPSAWARSGTRRRRACTSPRCSGWTRRCCR